MPLIYGKTIEGNSNDNVIQANHYAADALFEKLPEYANVYQAWDRVVDAEGGDDLILRDRPGDYVESAYLNFYHGGGFTEFYLLGNVLVKGGWGNDTVSYSAFSSALDIDLQPVAQQTAEEPAYWEGTADMSGIAKVKGAAGIEIHGHDYLHSIENAIGTQYNDSMKGSSLANTLEGLGGNDVLLGRGGNDYLQGGDGNDVVWGGTGGDIITGGNGNDTLNGESGNDGITGGNGIDKIKGGDGNDIIAGGLGNDRMYGGNDDDLIYGGGGRDRAHGEDGNDTIYVQGSGGWAYGGAGDDKVYGGNGNDFLHTGAFSEGVDEARGGQGNDRLVVGSRDLADGGAGTDQVVLKTESVEGGVFRLNLDQNGDGTFGWDYHQDGHAGYVGTLKGIESVKTGASDDDIMIVDDSRNEVDSGAGNDVIETAGGNDFVRARSGNDYVDAGSGDDNVFGGGGNDRIDGGVGEDNLNGGSGNDTLIGGQGDDVMTGGSGADGFVWKDGDHGLDTITDFKIGTDYIGIQDYLQNPVPMGGSYVGKVFALETWDGSATVLTAQTDNGWKSFARLEGLEVEDVWSAIQSGSLFAGGSNGGGPGGYVPVSGSNDAHGYGVQDIGLDIIPILETDVFAFA